jgi:LmbE family N-acetylglucosaminyl deacetylase
MTTLLILGHQDDEALSCGGLIQVRKAQGQEVHLITVFGRRYDYGQGDQHWEEQQEHWRTACECLKIDNLWFLGLPDGEPNQQSYHRVLRQIEQRLQSIAPTEVVIPDDQDRHQDHRWLHEVCKIALRPWAIPTVKRVLCAQSPDGQPKISNYYVPLPPEVLLLKARAICCYEREGREYPHPRSSPMMKAWHNMAGAACGMPLAEPYRMLYARD